MFYDTVWEYSKHKLVKRPDSPNYYIIWPRPGSRPPRKRSTHTDNLERAKQALVDFVQERNQLRPESPEQVDLLETLRGYVDRSTRGKSWHTAEKTALGHWTEFLESEDIATVSELTRSMQERYISWRRHMLRAQGHKGSNGTLSRELRVMRAALNDAWRFGQLTHVPHILSVTEPPPRQRILLGHEVARLIAACDQVHLYRFVMIALHTLQRPGAVLGLTKHQIDLDRGLIDFLPFDRVQSRKRRPVVPITDTIRPILLEAMRDSRTGHLIEWDGRPVVQLRRSFAGACQRAKLRDVSPITLRHTGASLALAAGVPIRQVAGMMGHTEQHTTELYGKHHVDFLGEAKSALDTLFAPKGPDSDE